MTLSASAAGLSGKAGPFKVVKPPARGARKRITIHNGTQSAPATSSAPRRSRHDWFWTIASPELRAADPARIDPLAATAAQRLGASGKPERLTKIATRFGSEITTAAAKASVPPRLLMAVIAAESGGDPRAVSSAGAQGLAQLIPATAQRFGVRDPFDPAQNLTGAAAYLAVLLRMFDGDPLLALAGYNAGENAVLRYEGVPPFAETRDYVPIVLSYLHIAGTMCDGEAPLAVGCG
ncbi:MAG: lytic transglycosylase domain-containing protein [Pseudomonadota bacterium]